jgi:hypothetical protein
MYFFNRSHGRPIVSHLVTLNGVSSRPAISWPWFTRFAGRTCSALFRPRGLYRSLSQCRSFRLIARNGFNVALRCYLLHSTKTTMRMQDTKQRAPSSRVLQEVIRQAPAEYVTVGWLTSDCSGIRSA